MQVTDLQRIGDGPGPTGMYCVKGDAWQHPVVAKAKCTDGVVRIVELDEEADNAFAWGGTAQIDGALVSGFVSSEENALGDREYLFALR